MCGNDAIDVILWTQNMDVLRGLDCMLTAPSQACQAGQHSIS